MGFFHFEKCQPGEYLYQTDLTQGMFRVSDDYRQFMADAGVEIISLWGPWVFLRRRAEEGPFELYTDVESSIEQYEKIRRMFKIILAVEIAMLMLEVLAMEAALMPGLVFTIIIGVIIGMMLREILRINSILAQLYERLGRPKEGLAGCGQRRISPILPIGIIINAFAVCIQDSFGHTVRMGLQIAAIALIGLGIGRTIRNRRRDGNDI